MPCFSSFPTVNLSLKRRQSFSFSCLSIQAHFPSLVLSWHIQAGRSMLHILSLMHSPHDPALVGTEDLKDLGRLPEPQHCWHLCGIIFWEGGAVLYIQDTYSTSTRRCPLLPVVITKHVSKHGHVPKGVKSLQIRATQMRRL